MTALPFFGGLAMLGGLSFFLGFKREQKDRRTILYMVCILLLGVSLGALVFYLNTSLSMRPEVCNTVLQIIIIMLGVFHVWWLYKKIFWSRRDSFSWDRDSFLMELVYTLLLTITLTAGILIFLEWANKPIVEFFWGAGLVFMVPLLVIKTYDLLMQIPGKMYAINWKFSKQRINENDWAEINQMWVYFEVKESWNKPGINRIASFKILAPRQVPLGEVFRLAVREYNKKGPQVIIQDLGFEPENEDHFWWLFTLKFIWVRPHTWFPNTRMLNPNDSLFTNDLRPDDIILARRIAFHGAFETDDEIAIGEI